MNISIIQIPNGNDIKGKTLLLIVEAAVGGKGTSNYDSEKLCVNV